MPGSFVDLCKLILSRSAEGRPAGPWTGKLSNYTADEEAGSSSLKRPIAEARGLPPALRALKGHLRGSLRPGLAPPFSSQPQLPHLGFYKVGVGMSY